VIAIGDLLIDAWLDRIGASSGVAIISELPE
jgi:deoxyribose-phosphate aldolase